MNYKTVAFIPLRGGSKSIPLKNIKLMAGKPLAYWTIKAAIDCAAIDKVVVSTDSEEIKKALSFIDSSKLTFFQRSPETATDNASTESAMWDYFSTHKCERLVLIQATSPLLTSDDLDAGFTVLENQCFDSVLSLVRSKRFFWREERGNVVPVNYSLNERPRRQDFKGELVENGAFYITSYALFQESRCRLNGKIGFHEMEPDSFVEIDELSDWLMVESFLLNRKKNNGLQLLKKIKVFATDIDGCLTDAGMYYSENGDELKKFNTRDGMGLKMLQQSGIKVGVITAEDRDLNRRRSKKLGLDFEYHKVEDKLLVLGELCKKYQVVPEEIAYVGDDVNDIGLLKAVGFSACPLDACREVKEVVNFIISSRGGEGVVRELSNLVLKG